MLILIKNILIFIVIKIVRVEPSSKRCFNYLTPFRHVFDLDLPCVNA